MRELWLTVELLSDTTFGRSAGTAGIVDVEIDHDHSGCPVIKGRTLKGLLAEARAEIRGALTAQGADWDQVWGAADRLLFGQPGGVAASMHVGTATLPPDLRDHLHQDRMSAEEVLESLTTVRRQTSRDATTGGAPERGSLRSARALLRETSLLAPITLPDTPPASDRQTNQPVQGAGKGNLKKGNPKRGNAKRPETTQVAASPASSFVHTPETALLTACALGVRHGGLHRHRGLGSLRLRLHATEPTTHAHYCDDHFLHTGYLAFQRLVMR